MKLILVDFSYTLCFPKTKEHISSLNEHYKEIKDKNPNTNALDNFIINQELLDFLKTLKSKFKIYIFTSGFMHSDPKIKPYLNPVFDGYLTSHELGLPKSFPDAYKVIANKLGVRVENILFIDDQQKNVQAAISAGAQGIQFTNNDELINKIQNIIKQEVDSLNQ